MIAVVRCYKHNIKPLVIEVFEDHDEQTQKDAYQLADILSRKNKCEYKVLIDLSYVAVIHDPFEGCQSTGTNPEGYEAFGITKE